MVRAAALILSGNAMTSLLLLARNLIVARLISVENYGIAATFAMGFTLTLTPTLVMGRSAQSFFLPQLSSAERDTPDLIAQADHIALVTFECHLVFGTALVLGTVLLGAPVVHILLGPKYADLVPMLPWLAIMQAFRVFKGGPSTVALAHGQTANAMVANLVRVTSLPLAWIVAVRTGEIFPVILIALAGEAIGFVVAMVLVRQRIGFRLAPLTWPILSSLVLLAVAVVGSPLDPPAWAIRVTVSLFFVPSLWTMRDLTRYLRGNAH